MGDARQWFRVKPSYQKPAGGFLAIGPRYRGEIVDGGKAVRFSHHGAQEWTETVAIDHVEQAPDPPKIRRRGK
jgi:hypothetical protein